MIQSVSSPPMAAASRPPASAPEQAPAGDRFDLTGVPTAVKMYDLSPVWSPSHGPVKIPMWVHGLA